MKHKGNTTSVDLSSQSARRTSGSSSRGKAGPLDTGDTAWVLASTALVLFMTPGLALFYGGMVRAKNVLGTLMHSVFAMGLISILWVLVGYTLAFGPDVGGLIGGLDFLGLLRCGWRSLIPHGLGATIPHSLFAIFQMMFAIITPALITGAFAERIKFSGYVVFMSRVAAARLRAGRPLGVAPGRLALQARRARLRRRHRRPHQRRHRSPGGDPRHRQAQGLRQGSVRASQPDDDDPRHGHPVVRLVRLQRR